MKGADIRFPCQRVVTDGGIALFASINTGYLYKKPMGFLKAFWIIAENNLFFCSKQTQVCDNFQQGNHHKLTDLTTLVIFEL